MRILGATPLAKRLSGVVDELIGRKDAQQTKIMPKKPAQKEQQFLTWPAPIMRNISAIVGFNRQPKVDINVLENFLNKSAKIEELYCGLMTTAMLRDVLEDPLGAHLSRVRALQQMVHLIKGNVNDIQTIALLNVSNSKG